MKIAFYVSALVVFPFSIGVAYQLFEQISENEADNFLLGWWGIKVIAYPFALLLSMFGVTQLILREDDKPIFLANLLGGFGWFIAIFGLVAFNAT